MVGTHLAGWDKNVEKSDIIVFKYLEMERRTPTGTTTGSVAAAANLGPSPTLVSVAQ